MTRVASRPHAVACMVACAAALCFAAALWTRVSRTEMETRPFGVFLALADDGTESGRRRHLLGVSALLDGVSANSEPDREELLEPIVNWCSEHIRGAAGAYLEVDAAAILAKCCGLDDSACQVVLREFELCSEAVQLELLKAMPGTCLASPQMRGWADGMITNDNLSARVRRMFTVRIGAR